MGDAVLLINPGSASRKYAVALGSKIVLRAHFELAGNGAEVTLITDENIEERTFKSTEFSHTTDYVAKEAVTRGIISDQGELAAVGLRIVAPGTFFQEHQLIDDEFFSKLEAAVKDAPLHIKPELDEIKHVRDILPGMPMYGISDSAFHVGIPDKARRYAIPETDAHRYGIHRYGFHGISLASIVTRLPEVLDDVPKRLIVCHLGSGASVTAIKDGVSVDTSMGFSPLEGLVMATRVGDIDPGALIHLAKAKGMSFTQLEHYLNTQCGLLGFSGQTADMRRLIDGDKAGEAAATLALDAFAYRIQKYIGAYSAALGGLDAVIFSATIAERSDYVRARICGGLAGVGVTIQPSRNDGLSGQDGIITTDDSPVTAAVVLTDELAEMARQTARLQTRS